MRVIFAKNIGFCSGVKRAIAIAEKSLREDPKPIQFLGPLIHNEKVVEELKKKGGKIIANLKEIKSGTLILRAHGEILNSKGIKNRAFIYESEGGKKGFTLFDSKKIIIRDSACPLVKRVQNAANFLFKQGYQVIIIGDKNHPETKGIKGCTKNRAIIIENDFQAKNLSKLKKIGAVSQTTQNLNKVNRILKILKNKAEEFKWVNTLCPEVIFRQNELSKIAKKTDGILVIGSRSSANTKRLVEIAKEIRKPVWWLNSLKELKKINFEGISSLGVVSGTSTPDWEIQKIKKWLEEKVK